MMNGGSGEHRRDAGKHRSLGGFRNHYGWWWIAAFMARSFVASKRT
jgi:hypothetical protein